MDEQARPTALPSAAVDDAVVALCQASGITDLLITALVNEDDKVEVPGAISGTLENCLFAIRSEIERAKSILHPVRG